MKPNDYTRLQCRVHGEAIHYGRKEANEAGHYEAYQCIHCVPVRKEPLKDAKWDVIRQSLEKHFAAMDEEQLQTAQGMIAEKLIYLNRFKSIMEPLRKVG